MAQQPETIILSVEAKTAGAGKSIDELRKALKEAEAAARSATLGTDEYKAALDKVGSARVELRAASKEFAGIGTEGLKSLGGINDQATFAKNTLGQLLQTQKQLKLSALDLTPGTKEFDEFAAASAKVNTRIAELQRQLKGSSSLADTLDKSLSKASKGLGSFFTFDISSLVQNGLGQLQQFVTGSLEAYDQGAQAEAQLQRALGERSDVQERLIQQAEDIAGRTTLDDDSIKEQQAYLATLGFQEDQIKQLIESSVQLSAVTGQDLGSSVDGLVKSLGGQSKALKGLGGDFQNLTKEQLQSGAALDLINEKFAGTAETAAKTGTGPLKQLSNQVGNIQEEIGGGIAALITELQPLIQGAFQLFKQLFDGISAGLVPLRDAVGPLFEALGRAFSGLFGQGDSAVSFGERVAGAVKFITLPLTVLVDVLTFLLDLVLPPLLAILRPIIDGFVQLGNALPGIVSVIKNLGGIIQKFLIEQFEALGQVLQGVFDLDLGEIRKGAAKSKAAFGQVGADIGQAYGAGLTKAAVESSANAGTKAGAAFQANNAKGLAQAKKDAEKYAADVAKILSDLNKDIAKLTGDAELRGIVDPITRERVRITRAAAVAIEAVRQLAKATPEVAETANRKIVLLEADKNDALAELDKQAKEKADERQKEYDERVAKSIGDSVQLNAAAIEASIQADAAAREQEKVAREAADARLKESLANAQLIADNLTQILGEQSAAGALFAQFSKTLSLYNIAIASAEGVAQAVKAGAGIPFPANLGAILAGVAAVTSGIAQATALLGGDAPQAPKYAAGGILSGPRHSRGGISLMAGGRKVGEAEGGEIVLTRGVTRSPRLLQAASALNMAGGGAPLVPGIRTPRMAAGGLVPAAGNVPDTDAQVLRLLNRTASPTVSVIDYRRVDTRERIIDTRATI